MKKSFTLKDIFHSTQNKMFHLQTPRRKDKEMKGKFTNVEEV